MDINTVYAEYRYLDDQIDNLLAHDKLKAALALKDKFQAARDNYRAMLNSSRSPEPWGDLFDINQVPRSELWQVVANHLSGLKIDLYMNDRELYDTLGVWGGARKIDQKRASIQISDHVGVDGKFWGLLHEAAHIRLDHTGGNIASQESEANTLAAQWREFAEKNTNRVGDHRQLKYEALLRACLLIKVGGDA